MKVCLVYGGRDYGESHDRYGTYRPQWQAEVAALMETLDHENPDGIIEGGAKGADHLGRVWAERRGKKHHQYPARWRVKGVFNRQAGYERNAQMVAVVTKFRDRGDLFYGLECKGGNGTADTHNRLTREGFAIVKVPEV